MKVLLEKAWKISKRCWSNSRQIIPGDDIKGDISMLIDKTYRMVLEFNMDKEDIVDRLLFPEYWDQTLLPGGLVRSDKKGRHITFKFYEFEDPDNMAIGQSIRDIDLPVKIVPHYMEDDEIKALSEWNEKRTREFLLSEKNWICITKTEESKYSFMFDDPVVRVTFEGKYHNLLAEPFIPRLEMELLLDGQVYQNNTPLGTYKLLKTGIDSELQSDLEKELKDLFY